MEFDFNFFFFKKFVVGYNVLDFNFFVGFEKKVFNGDESNVWKNEIDKFLF